MEPGLVSKIYKARMYAEDRDRFSFNSLEMRFQGKNRDHTIKLADGKWSCTCEYFGARTWCSHTLATQRLLKGMVIEPEEGPKIHQA